MSVFGQGVCPGLDSADARAIDADELNLETTSHRAETGVRTGFGDRRRQRPSPQNHVAARTGKTVEVESLHMIP